MDHIGIDVHKRESQRFVAHLTQQHGKAKALTIFAHKLARAVYCMLRREQVFDATRFFAGTTATPEPPIRAPLAAAAARGPVTSGAPRGARIPPRRPRRQSPGVVPMTTQRRRGRDAAGEAFGVGGIGGAQHLGPLLPLALGQAVMDIVGRHQAQGDMAMLGVVLMRGDLRSPA